MSNDRIYKTLAFITLLVEFIIFFILFGKIRNMAIDYNISENISSTYILLIVAVAFAVILFVLTILSSYKKDSENKYLQKQIDLTEHHVKNIDNELEKEELLDIELYSKKILPQNSAKLDLIKYTEKILSNIAKEFDIVQGLFFVKEKETEIFNIQGKYAYFGDEEPKSFNWGETLSGQVAKNKKALNLEEIPENYVTILSGLGSSSPNHLIIIPVIFENKTIAIIELASFKEFKQNIIDLFEGLSEHIGKALMKF